MNAIYEEVNSILAQWDPLNVGTDLALDEYRAYAPRLIRNLGERERLKTELEEILLKEMVCDFQHDDPLHMNSIEELCDKLQSVDRKSLG